MTLAKRLSGGLVESTMDVGKQAERVVEVRHDLDIVDSVGMGTGVPVVSVDPEQEVLKPSVFADVRVEFVLVDIEQGWVLSSAEVPVVERVAVPGTAGGRAYARGYTP